MDYEENSEPGEESGSGSQEAEAEARLPGWFWMWLHNEISGTDSFTQK